MTALPGGAADKAGNVYEHLWIATRIGDLLHGAASRINIEPPGDDGVGIEFEVDLDGETWGEQTKNSGSTWTIKRLREDDVLAGAKHQIESGRGFRLITASAATSLETLSNRARSTDTVAAFRVILTAKLGPDFDDIVRHWGVTEEQAWELLKRVVVEHQPLAPLRRNARLAYQALYSSDPDLLIAAVREFCDNHVHEHITAPQVAAHLKNKGFKQRLLAGDDDARRRLHRTLERQQRRVQSAVPEFGLVPRTELDRLIQDLENPDTPRVVIVDGPAGYGKSAVACEVASRLDASGWFVAVARMDVETATPTSDHLGQQMSLSDSPSVVLTGVADGRPGLLVVEQLDAVSFFSGRMPDSFDAVEEVLEEIGRSPNLKVLLVVRTIDLENDPRLVSLACVEGLISRHTLDKLGIDDVRRHLTEHGVHVPSDETVDLLRTPLHLAVYGRLSDDARKLPYRTVQDLYDQLTPEVRRRAAGRAGHLDWLGITSALVSHMSDHETLTAPHALLDPFNIEEVTALESESVLVRDENGTTFFHESYFDYLFARAFVLGGDLHAFLASTGQFLFRRAQTRQVLEYLAATDRPRFRVVSAELLASPEIRPHLKHIVVGVLRRLTPVPEDWAAVDEVAWSDDPIGWPLLNLLSDPQWFDAADQLGRWEQWLADPDRVERAVHALTWAGRQRGERAAALVRPYIGTTEEWRLRMRTLVAWSLNPALVPLAVELIEGGHVDDARGSIAVNSHFWSIVHGLLEDDPVGAARVTGAFLRRGLDRARAEGSADPFESEHLAAHSPSDQVIREVAERAPHEFIEEVLSFVISTSQANQHERDGLLPAGARWGYRHRGSEYSVDDVIFGATEEALCRLAVLSPDRARATIVVLRTIENDELRVLACRTLTVLDDSDEAIAWLIDDPRNLALGWSDSQHWVSRELIAAHSRHCSDELYTLLETAILDYRCKYERKAPRHGQYVLLSGLDQARMSDSGRRRLTELERRFDALPTEPRPVMASFVGSPIASDATKRMSDDNWLAALRKHDAERTDWIGGVPVGGASQLARVLGERAGEEPERFARLALRFDASIPATAAAHVIRAVNASVDLGLLTDLCDHTAALYGDDVGRDVCSAIETAEEVNSRLVALVELYSRSTDPNREWARTDAGLGGQYYGGNFFDAGLNSTRGGAAFAAAAVLFKGGDYVEQLLPLVERLATDGNIGVRTCAAAAVTAFFNHDNESALEFAERLLDAPVDVFKARTTERLLTHCVLPAPERFVAHLERALDGPVSVAERAGHIWAVADFRGALAPPVSGVVRDLPTGARVGAAQVFAENVADSAEALAGLFDDSDAKVREAASRGMRHIAELSLDAADVLIERFIVSAAFAESMDDLIDSLEKLDTKLPASVLKVCERAVEVGSSELGEVRLSRAAVGRDLITVVLRLYRQGDEQTRSRCLDIIDRLTEINAYDLDRALADER